MFSARPPYPRQVGLSLIEVLVGFLILSIAIAGFSGLQLYAVGAARSSLQRTDAAVLASSILDAMHANRFEASVAGGAQYNIKNQCAQPAVGATLAAYDLQAWFDSLHQSLGDSACASIICNTNNFCTVDISWEGSPALSLSTAQRLQLVAAL